MTAHFIAVRHRAVCPRGGAFARVSFGALGEAVVRVCLPYAGFEVGREDEVILSAAVGVGEYLMQLVRLASGMPG